MHSIDFDTLINYDPGVTGITVQTTLKFADVEVSFPAKLDTGASFCIFERSLGERLGLNIEDGLFQRVGTATGTFVVFGFRLILVVDRFELDSLVYFAQDEAFNRNVLGRRGWLELVKIGLIDYEGKLFLSAY